MELNSDALINELLLITERASDQVRKFKQLKDDQLNFRNSPDEWSVLECIEHLNLYGDFYLPEIERQVIVSKGGRKSGTFKSGIIGNYFANLMKVKDGKVKKLKSPKDKNPVNRDLTITSLERFLKQQELLKSLLQQAKTVDLTRTKVPISLTKFIKLRLGDTFRFFVYHIERHICQAESANRNQNSGSR
jgi:hypothetical protein